MSSTLLKVAKARSLTAESTSKAPPKPAAKKTVAFRERPIDALLSKFASLEERSRGGWLTATRPDSMIPFISNDRDDDASRPPSGSGHASLEPPAEAHAPSLHTHARSLHLVSAAHKSKAAAGGNRGEGAAPPAAAAGGGSGSGSPGGRGSPTRAVTFGGDDGGAAGAAGKNAAAAAPAAAEDLASAQMQTPNLAHRFSSSTMIMHAAPPMDDDEAEIDEDEARNSAIHRAYRETAFALRIPKSATVWRQLWSSSIELQYCQLGSKGVRALAGALRCEGARCSYLGLMVGPLYNLNAINP